MKPAGAEDVAGGKRELEGGSVDDGQRQSLIPSISLPKGGGAVRGVGEKFAANPVTGTGSMTVPLPLSPGRAGFVPQMALSYDSGSGNGPFGYGWSLALPAITRKTDKGLPQYIDAAESDVFLLSGAEDLVPVSESTHSGFAIKSYRPRVEGLFARIERWTNSGTGDVHWRSVSRDNVTTLYGEDASSRISDPGDETRVFSWLICKTYDDKGNAAVYEYVAENAVNVELLRLNERSRSRTANRYLKRIKYGNTVSRLVEPDLSLATWLFEVVFDYGEGHYTAQAPDPMVPADEQHAFVAASNVAEGEWPVRPDPFSVYRAGFEVRTYRRCQRVLMFHRFEELGEDPCLVRSLEFDYADFDYVPSPSFAEELQHQGSTRLASFIQSMTSAGYLREEDVYVKKSLPPLEFEYSKAQIQDQVRQLDESSAENLPVGFDGSTYQWVDLDGEGVSGILAQQSGAWFYKPNLGEGQFGAARTVDPLPSLLAGGRGQLLDLSGDGRLDVVSFLSPTPGFYERTPDEDWEPFRIFRKLPRLRWDDPNLRFVDLDGDGHADVLITEDSVLTWYPSLGEEGFDEARKVSKPLDDETGPRLVFADGTQSIFLADFSGDGLTDLVRIRNGDVSYWPNLGYGRFGAKVGMDNAPLFDVLDQFDQRRIRLADIDGSGTTDIIYLHRDGARVYFNQSGNRWSAARQLVSPAIENFSAVSVADLLGNGTACLVWSSPLPADAHRPLRFVDLMGGVKPNLLVKSRNNLGAETVVHYAPSTKFYLADKAAGRPWVTKLPFPVHVVERVVTVDDISGNRFSSCYRYHHGYFDGFEREFRGFGMVEQQDTEQFTTIDDVTNNDEATHVPPVLTKTWFHTGVVLESGPVTRVFAEEYYREPGLTDGLAEAKLLPDTVLPEGLTFAEQREACRSLRGAMLRQEVYALDADASPERQERAATPYSVAEQNFTIKCLQTQGGNRHGVFFTHAREVLSYHYERNPVDPRTTHALTLDVDDFGNVKKSLAVAYGRASEDAALSSEDQEKQSKLLLTYTDSSFTNLINTTDAYRTPLPAVVRTWELTGFTPDGARFTFDEFSDDDFAALDVDEIDYEEVPGASPQEKRLVEEVRTRYRRNDLSNLLAVGELESQALPGEAFKRALTPSMVTAIFGSKLPSAAAVLEGTGADQGGYVSMDGAWWVHSGRSFFDQTASIPSAELTFAKQHFFVPHRAVDAFGHATVVTYDDYTMLPTQSVDAVGNMVQSENDYRVLQPWKVTDANGNRVAAAFDALGLVVATAMMGKAAASEGDELADFPLHLTLAQLQAFAESPLTEAPALLGHATTRLIYDVERFARCGQPPLVATLARETHYFPAEDNDTAIQVSFSFSDGFGREVQKKVRAEDGSARAREAPVSLPSGDIAPGALDEGSSIASPRWVGTGRVVFNNKGKPVKQYEPFFSSTHLYEEEAEVTETGVSPVLFYDPVGRVVATLHPNHAYEKITFDNWKQSTWDANDTSELSPKTDTDIAGYVSKYFDAQPPDWEMWAERQSEVTVVEKTQEHAGTPAVAHLDSQGRVFLTLADNVTAKLATRVEFDIEGNQRAVSDAFGRVVMKYDYDMLGTRLHQASMEAGERWTLTDSSGKPIRAWDSRGFVRRMTYDALRRPTGLYVTESSVERLAEKVAYGETQGDAGNHRGRVFQSFDAAGVVTSEAYDFKGNLLATRRDVADDYKTDIDWTGSPTLGEVFNSSTEYDALNRPLAATAPDGSVYLPTFNEAGLLDAVDVKLRGASAETPFVANVAYNAKGQREAIAYANGATTEYSYDEETFRLTRLNTTRPSNPDALVSQLFASVSVVQDISYTYDAVGNILKLADAALETVFYDNQEVAPECEYVYDALYRLVEASGRESIGQTAFAPNFDNPRDFPFVGSALNPNDLQALRRFTQEYAYDDAGNLLVLAHAASGNTWTQEYAYEEASQLAPSDVNNRLTSTTVGASTSSYTYDIHGNMLGLPHVSSMAWNFKDEFQSANLGGGGTAYYVYDSSGQRVRKVLESQLGVRSSERLYVGGFEVWREYKSDGVTVETARETLHVMDDTQRIALVETLTVDEGTDVSSPTPLLRYQLGNHLGSSSIELDADAALISYEEYHPYGTTSLQAHNSNAEVSAKRYRYTSKERDDETGLSYHSARYYAPWLARWTSTDPSGIQDSLNLFQYVKNAPTRGTDPTGRETFEHASEPENVAEILTKGFDPNKGASGYSWFQPKGQDTTGGPSMEGKTAILDAEHSGVTEGTISYKQLHQWYKNAEASLSSEKGLTGQDLQRAADAERWKQVGDYMKAEGKASYRIELGKGRGIYLALNAEGLAGLKITSLRGAGAGEVLVKLGDLMAKQALAGDSKGVAASADALGASAAASKQLGRAASAIKWAGRPLLVLAAARDGFEIYTAENKTRTVTSVATGWAGAWAGGKAGSWAGVRVGAGIALGAGQFGPQVAAPEEVVTVPVAGAIGGIVGGIGGSIGGYMAGREISETVYDWAFSPGMVVR